MAFNFKIKNNGTGVPTEIDNGDSNPERVDDTFERYARYREWNKTHDCYKVLYSPYGNDEKGNKIK